VVNFYYIEAYIKNTQMKVYDIQNWKVAIMYSTVIKYIILLDVLIRGVFRKQAACLACLLWLGDRKPHRKHTQRSACLLYFILSIQETVLVEQLSAERCACKL